MKSTIFAVAAVFLLAATVNAEPIVAQSYPINSVLELSAGGGVEIEITQGDVESLRAEATAEVMKRVNVDQTNHRLTLKVKSENGNFFHWFDNNNDQVKFILQIKQLNYAEFSGATEVTMSNYRGEKLVVKNSGAAQTHFSNLQVNNIAFESSGAANVEIQTLNSQKVDVNLSGASNFEVKKSGVVQQLIIEASGASNYASKSLVVSNADVQASGASNIEILVNETLKAGASGASTIDYYGSAKVTSDSSGASHIDGH